MPHFQQISKFSLISIHFLVLSYLKAMRKRLKNQTLPPHSMVQPIYLETFRICPMKINIAILLFSVLFHSSISWNFNPKKILNIQIMAEHSYSRFLRQIQSFENTPQSTEFELRSERLNQNEINRKRICNNFKVTFSNEIMKI